MNNFKKIGMTALAASLVSTSVFAGELAVSGSAGINFENYNAPDSDTSASNGTKAFSMGNQITFSGSGELDNGLTVALSFTLDQGDNDLDHTTTAEGAGGGGSGAAKGGDTDTAPPTVSSSGLVSGLPPFPGSPILRNTHGTIPGHAAPPPITFLPDTVGVVGGWQPPWDRVAARASEEGNTTDNEVKEESVNDDEHGAMEGNVAKADHVKDAKTWSFPNSPAFSSDASSGVSSTSQIIHAARTTPCAQAGSSSDAASDYRTTNGASNDATTDDATTRRLRALDAAERRRCDAM